MALSPREFVEEVNKYFGILEQKRKNIKVENNYGVDHRVVLGDLDLSDIKSELFEITMSLHRLFIAEQSINNLSASETAKILKRARLLALGAICETFKFYDNKKEDNFWQFYSIEGDLYLNETFFKKIVEPSLIEEGILRAGTKGKINYTDYIAKESNLSLSCLEDVFTLFRAYFKYFCPSSSIKDFFKEIISSIEGYKSSFDFLDKESTERAEIESAYKKILEFKTETQKVIENLVSFVDFINRSTFILSHENFNEILEEYNKYYNKELSYIFNQEEIKNLFVDNFSPIPIYKFIKILEELPTKTNILLPDNSTLPVEDYLDTELCLGIHKINNKDYNLFHQCFQKDELLALDNEKITVLGNNVFIKSENSFVVMLGNSDSNKKSHKVTMDNKHKSFLWLDNKPILETISVESDFSEIDSLYPGEALLSTLVLKLRNQDSAPNFDLNLESLVIVSRENKGKKVELINTDQVAMLKEFPIDDTGYSGEIVYPIKDKRPGKIDILLISDKEPLHLNDFESRLTYELEESILFNGTNGAIIKPSESNISYGSDKMFLFTIKRFDYKWLNESCEVYECKNFGRYHVYEIHWLDKTKPLNLNIDSEYRWNFVECLDFKLTQKFKAYKNAHIEHEINQLFDFDDVHINLNIDNQKIDFKDLTVNAFVNFTKSTSNVSFALINKLSEREENSSVIDRAFFEKLLPNTNLSYGRYDLELYVKGSYLTKYTFFIVPNLSCEEYAPVYQENEDIILTLKSSVPCFRNNKNTQGYKFDLPAMAQFKLNSNKMIEVTKQTYTKKAKLFNPYTELILKYEPEVIALRFMQDGRIFNSDSISYYDIDKTSLILKSPYKDARLKVNNNVVKPIISNSMGVIIEPLTSIKQYLSKNDNLVSIQIGKYDLDFQVVWNTKVSNFQTSKFVDSYENGIKFSMSYEGAQNALMKFIVTDENGNHLEIKRTSCGEDSAPKCVRTEKNYMSIICDGKKWENREFTLHFEPSIVMNTKELTIKGLLENDNEPFGELLIKNTALIEELSVLSSSSDDSKNPYVFFEKGFILSENANYDLAKEYFDKALANNIDDKDALEYIDFFEKNKSIIMFENEISEVNHLAQKFVMQELLLDFK